MAQTLIHSEAEISLEEPVLAAGPSAPEPSVEGTVVCMSRPPFSEPNLRGGAAGCRRCAPHYFLMRLRQVGSHFEVVGREGWGGRVEIRPNGL